MREPFIKKTTIAAVATPQGSGGISVVKVSGPDSLSLLESVFRGKSSPSAHPRKMLYGKIAEGNRIIDDVLVCYMKSPRSYTGEDVVEIQTHGGKAASSEILDLFLRNGARPAAPGEFTKRAFLNGKIDLIQAEAVQQITEAESRLALLHAERMHEGLFSREIEQSISTITDTIAALEMHIDFSDQHAAVETSETIRSAIEKLLSHLASLLRASRGSRKVRQGFRTVIAGNVNTGKSSLFNALLGKQRALVNARPGTTRDWIEEKLEIEGILFDLLDTAGLRETGDEVERMGVRASRRLIQDADIVLYLASSPAEYPDAPEGCTVRAVGKADLIGGENRTPGVLYVSSLTGEGIEECRNVLVQTARGLLGTAESEVMFLLDRHVTCLENARRHLEHALESLHSWSEEITVLELTAASQELSSLLGQSASPDILDAIFRNFCIGK